jgi:hypothetical protein
MLTLLGVPQVLAAEQPVWQNLRFEARKLLGSVVVNVDLHSLGPQAADRVLRKSTKGGDLQPGQDRILVLDTRVRAEMPLVRKHWQGAVWFLEDYRALQRRRLKLGNDGSAVLFRHGSRRVYRERSEPRNKEQSQLPAEQWPVDSQRYFPYPDEASGCGIITDPTALLHLISSRPLNDLDGFEICAFNKKTIYRVSISTDKVQQAQATFKLTGAGGQRKVDDTVEAMPVLLRGQPLDPGRADAFEFLGLEGQSTILMGVESRLPIAIQGSIKDIGQVEFNLSAATLR